MKKITSYSYAGFLWLSLIFVGCKKLFSESTPPDAAPNDYAALTPTWTAWLAMDRS